MYEMVIVLMDGTKFLFCDTLDRLADRLESFREMGLRKGNIKIMAGK
jgi:hypothetical protein